MSEQSKIQLVIISGRSGSGKSVALRALEDLGYYCIDNLPVSFLPELMKLAEGKYPRIAVSIDIRNMPENFHSLESIYSVIKKDPMLDTTLIYVDADDQVLLKRYLETRRLHPLSRKSLSLDQAIVLENKILSSIASIADLRIDTSNLSIHDLSGQINTLIAGRPERKLVIVFESFGFKYGIAKDADFVFDSRFLPNPYWEKELREHNGLDREVKDFFARYPEVDNYIDQIDRMITDHLPQIETSNRSYLTVSIGCTGGYHRSVFVAQALGDRFKARGIDTQIRHRELEKDTD